MAAPEYEGKWGGGGGQSLQLGELPLVPILCPVLIRLKTLGIMLPPCPHLVPCVKKVKDSGYYTPGERVLKY